MDRNTEAIVLYVSGVFYSQILNGTKKVEGRRFGWFKDHGFSSPNEIVGRRITMMEKSPDSTLTGRFLEVIATSVRVYMPWNTKEVVLANYLAGEGHENVMPGSTYAEAFAAYLALPNSERYIEGMVAIDIKLIA